MFEFKLPDLGEGVHEGQVVNVLVKEGETIGEYQPMLEIETDKAAVEIPAPKGGVVARIHVEPGQVVKVGQVLITIDDGGAAQPAGDGRSKQAAQPAEKKAPAKPAPSEKPQSKPAPEKRGVEREVEAVHAKAPALATATAEPVARAGEGPVAAAPAVRKLARELKVDISAVPGSGPDGRILREDVERYAAGEPAPASEPERAVSVPAGELPDFSQYGAVRREAVSQIRKTIARQMTRAWLSVPRVTHCDTADVTDLERNRKQYNAGLREGEAKLTITAIVIKALAAAVRDFPMVNASYDAAREEIIYKDYVHVGIAVDTPRGLVVPVLRDADRKALPQIAAELSGLGARAQALKLEIAELRGASITITNPGALGGTFLTPMVNYPEVAILGLGAARLQPVVYEGQIVARLILPLSLSFDHRIVDGADAARFTTAVIRSLENPLRLISLA
jgi:pyruvate dehydrogenase E2 component (dihydrolipoamide acetyltransferase)